FALAEAAAVLDMDAELRHAGALAGLTLAAAERAADELALARILGPRRPLRFTHPILRAAVYAQIPLGRRAAAHRQAADLLDASLLTADQAALHLLAAEPSADPWVIDRLRAAAERALARGAPDAAVALLERARREPCDEPSLRLVLG